MKYFNELSQRVAAKLGYELIARWRLPRREFSDHLRDLFKMLNISCVLDVGANRGQYHDFLRNEVGFDGAIVSFEPVRHNVAILQERAKADPKWRICDFALGAADGELSINVMNSDDFSSFLTPDSTALPLVKEMNSVHHQEKVAIKRLDAVLATLPGVFDNIYLKLDTQGFDLQVIEGAQGILPQVSALQTEVAVRPIYQGMVDYFVSIRQLNERGFDLTGLFPVTRDPHLRVVEFDCVMVNRARCATQAAGTGR